MEDEYIRVEAEEGEDGKMSWRMTILVETGG